MSTIDENTRFVGIDPSTKLGFVILDYHGNTIESIEIKASDDDDPERMINLAKRVRKHLNPTTDKIAIEGFSYGSKGRGVSVQYGIGWIVRAMLFIEKIPFTEVAPTALKKYASGMGTIKKENMIMPIYKKWGFESSSDNVRDAYVLAHIIRGCYFHDDLTNYQIEVLKNVKKV